MQKSKIVTLVAAAALAVAFGSAASAQAVKNPSGGLVGQPPNFPTAGTATYLDSRSRNVAPKAVKNPSGGLVGQPPNFATAGTTSSAPGKTAAVRNPSGGVVGQPPNFPTPVPGVH